MGGLSPVQADRPARRWRALVAACLAGVVAAAPAQVAHRKPAPAPRAASVPQFADPEALHDAILQARAQAMLLLEPAAGADSVDFYFQRLAGDREAHSVTIAVDGQPALALVLEASVADPADDSALRRVGRLHLGVGEHRVQAQITGSDAALAGDATFRASPGALSVVLRPRAASLMHHGGIELTAWRGVAPGADGNPVHRVLAPEMLSLVAALRLYDEDSADDPQLRDARGLLDAGRTDEAVIELRAAALRAGNANALPAGYWLQRASAERSAGLLDHAEALTAALPAHGVDAHDTATEQLHLADAEFEASRFDRAQALLDRCRASLPPHMDLDWRFTQAQLMFEHNQTDAALQILRVANRADIEAFRYLVDSEGSLRSANYRRFNLAVALLKHHRDQLGLSWLDLVGRYQGRDHDLLALRDRANVTMGWRFLQLREGRSAIAALGRVSSAGPYANAALLGDGWCQLAPPGRWLSRASLGNEQRDAPDPFDNLAPVMKHSLGQLHVLEPELNGEFGASGFLKTSPPVDHKEALRKAVEIWKILAGRDIDDPAVEEAVVAIAYATGQLGDRQHSWDAYNVAATRLGGVQLELERTLGFVRQGGLAAAIGQAGDTHDLYRVMERLRLPPDDPTRGLYAAIDRYREGHDALGALERSRRALASQPGDAPAQLARTLQGLQQAVGAEQVADARQIEAAALQQLQTRRLTLDRYVVAASESMMRYADSAAPPARAEGPSRTRRHGS